MALLQDFGGTKKLIEENIVNELMKEVLDSTDLSQGNKQYFITEIWERTNENTQKNKLELIINQIEESKDIDEKSKLSIIGNIWAETSREVQKDNIELFDKLVKELKEYKNPEELDDDFDSFILDSTSAIDNKEDIVKKIWKHTAKEIQIEKLDEVISIIEGSPEIEDKANLVYRIWENTSEEAQISNKDLLSKIIEMAEKSIDVEDDGYIIGNIWVATVDEVKKDKPEVLDQIIKIAEDKPNIRYIDRSINYIWENTTVEIQKSKIEVITNMVKDSKKMNDNMKLSIIQGIWENTEKEVQKDNPEIFNEVIDMIEKNPNLNEDTKEYKIETLWQNTSEEIQKDNIKVLNKMIEKVINNKNLNFYERGRKFRNIWGNTSAKVQNDNPEILGILIKNLDEADRLNWIANVWDATKKEVREDIISKAIESILKNNEDKENSLVSSLWRWTEDEIKSKKLSEIINVLGNSKDIDSLTKAEAIQYIWRGTPEKIQQDNSKELGKIINIIESIPSNEKIGIMNKIWKNTAAEVQRDNADIFDRLIKNIEDNSNIDDLEKAFSLRNIWEYTKNELQIEKVETFNKIISNIMDNPNIEEKKKIQIAERLWMTSTAKVQRSNLGFLNDLAKRILESEDIEYEDIGTIWRETDKLIQKENIGKIIKEIDDNPELEIYVKEILIENIWGNTAREVQSDRINQIIKDIGFNKDSDNLEKQKKIGLIWEYTKKEVQRDSILNIVDLLHDGTNLDDETKALMIDSILSNTNKNALNAKICDSLWNKMTPNQQKKYLGTFINKFCEKQETYAELPAFLRKINENIDAEKLTEILTMKDNEYISKLMVNNIVSKNIVGNSNINIENVNQEIEKIHNMFMTNNLPETFKLFEFFKYHDYNYSGHNTNLYSDEISNESRDKAMLCDLFKASLDSDNKQLANFMELLRNGDIAYDKKRNDYKLDENEQAILYSYRDTLFDLYRIYGDEKLEKSSDFYADIEDFREKMHLDKDANIGETLLLSFLQRIDFDLEKYDNGKGKIVYETLLEHMKQSRKEALERNKTHIDVKELLQQGDLIKGTDIKYIDTQLRLGIRSKEFYMEGSMQRDCTPFDTDFSEITDYNIMHGEGLGGIIGTTVSRSYGHTFYVVKKGDYDEDRSYTEGNEQVKTRYLRTAIGSNAISCIITSQWSDEYAYTMAQNGIYIPVVDTKSEEIVFTYEQYAKIRESMKGLSFYRADDFEIDENAFNESILTQAEEMKSQADGMISTEEKRNKIIALIEKTLPKKVAQDMIGNISNEVIEFIDTGSTGRGTNIPGDGDFDFMLKCSNKDEQAKYIALLRKALDGEEKGGTNEFNIRYEEVSIEGLDTPVDIDITSETKRLELEYSSDLCVRDRLNGIRDNYGEEVLSKVVDNILVAKKTLKEMGTYKKTGSKSATELGGFGGIGVENWILQNGGSFILAMETFLDNTRDEEGNEINFEEFKEKYPIYDFGQNHRNSMSHDHFVEGLTKDGFKQMKEKFPQVLKEYGIEYEYSKEGHAKSKVEQPMQQKQPQIQGNQKQFKSIDDQVIEYAEEESKSRYKFSDRSKINSIIAKFKAFMQKMTYKTPEQLAYEK